MPLDDNISLFLNGMARQSVYFDLFLTQILLAPTFKMAPIMMCLVVVWSRRDMPNRAAVLAILGGVVAMVLARLLQNFGSHRPRPIQNPDLNLVDAYGHAPGTFVDFSSFPSDHAALVFALSAGVWVGSRGLGAFAFAWSTFIVCLPRLYLGLHYASDLVGGALIGVVAVWLVARIRLDGPILRAINAVYSRRPEVVNVVAFLLLFQMITLFDDLRVGAGLAARAAEQALGIGREIKVLRDEARDTKVDGTVETARTANP